MNTVKYVTTEGLGKKTQNQKQKIRLLKQNNS